MYGCRLARDLAHPPHDEARTKNISIQELAGSRIRLTTISTDFLNMRTISPMMP